MIDKDEQIEILLGLTKEMASLGLSRCAEMNKLRMINCDMHEALTKYRDMYLENTDLNRQGRFFVYVKEILAKASPNHVDTEK